MIFGYTFLIMVNVGLFFGKVEGYEQALNLAEFAMWVLAILSFLSMFADDKNVIIRKNKLIRYSGLFFTFITVMHSISWGYVWAPTIWATAIIVIYARKTALLKKEKKNV